MAIKIKRVLNNKRSFESSINTSATGFANSA
jgi:hypothetical protein